MSNLEPSPDAGEMYMFRLFSAPKASTTAPAPTLTTSNAESTPLGITQIKLDDTSSLLEKPTASSLLSSRPLSHYLAPAASPTLKARYESSAANGVDVRRRAGQPCYGLRMQWRVVSARLCPELQRLEGTTNTGDKNTNDAEASQLRRTRTRKGKKTRLRIRMKVRVREEIKRKRVEEEAAKEAYLKEKKAKVNRAKQIKKREKARQQKELLGETASVERSEV